MSTVGGLPGQFQHFRAQRRDHGFRGFCWRQPLVGSRGHALQVFFHGGDGWAVIETSNPFHQWLMGDPETEQEATARLFVERVLRREGHTRFAVVNIGDTGREVQRAGVG